MNHSRLVAMTVVFCLLLIPSVLSAGSFSFRLYGGGNYLSGGDLNKGLQGWADYWTARRIDEGYALQSGSFNPVHLGLGAGGDILFHLTPRLAVGIGTEYIAASKSTSFAFQAPLESIDWEYVGKPSAVPVKLSVFYFLPLGDRMKVGIHAGAGYYWADARIESDTTGSEEINYLIESKAKGIGFHGGIALEMKLLSNISVFIEAAGRYLSLSGFTGSVTIDEGAGSWDGTLHYWEATTSFISRYGYIDLLGGPPSGSSIFLSRDAKIDFSGASLRIGVVIGI